ncbi:MAG TPA: DEAD/DEAH box helicase, partial [Verrucomicrobiae bacterium]
MTQSESPSAAGNWFADLLQAPAVQALARRVEHGGALSFSGMAAVAQPFLAAVLQKLLPRHSFVIVTENLKAQENFQQDIETWLQVARASDSAPATAFFYPAWEMLPHEGKLPHADVISERLQTLAALADRSTTTADAAALVVTSVAALLQKTFAPADLRMRMRRLRAGDRIAPLDLVEFLEEQGYEPEAQVSQKGELALRGGIIDVFPPTSPWPVRLEFFGDELESLRYFDPATQISREGIATALISPAGEIGILKKQLESAAPAKSSSSPHSLPATLLDHVPPKTVFLLCNPDALAVHAENYSQQIPANDPFSITWAEFQQELNRRGFTPVELIEEAAIAERPEADAAGRLPQFSSLDAFRPLPERAPEPHIAEAQRREFLQQLHRWLRQNYAVHVFCNNDGERQRFLEIWKELGLADAEKGSASGAVPAIHLGSLARGFICDDAKLVIVTDAEIFGRYKIQRPRKLKSPHAVAARSALDIDFTDLEEGDLVVHLQHGIGRYLGLKTLPAVSRAKAGQDSPTTAAADAGTECLVIEYAPSDPANEPPKLYVPVSEAHLVSKYVGAGKAHPPLNTLGGNRWAKAKEQAEKAVRDVAAELLRIQAVRESQPGHPCKPDTQWQREFESAFIYEETPDQLKAITETKADQERAKPMDRLICGDVGFGKTEVAIRAAFKCVMDGRQVAVLVPTTVLAQQHFNNFRERMADYPIRVELLSRFRTRGEQSRVVRDLAAGAVDIVIGTHRIVQEDIAFKDLGLVVIDEEQRFGVL